MAKIKDDEKDPDKAEDDRHDELVSKTKLEEFHENNEYRKLMRKHELPMSA